MSLIGYIISLPNGTASGGVCEEGNQPSNSTVVSVSLGQQAATNPGQFTWDGKVLTPVPVPTPPPQPNSTQFVKDVKTALGGILAIAQSPSLAALVMTANAAISVGDWPDVQTVIAASSGSISSGAYQAIKTSATTNNIPITL